MGKGSACIDNRPVEGKPLALVYGYSPGQLQRILGKRADYLFLNLFGILIQGIFHVLPFSHLHPYVKIVAGTPDNYYAIIE